MSVPSIRTTSILNRPDETRRDVAIEAAWAVAVTMMISTS